MKFLRYIPDCNVEMYGRKESMTAKILAVYKSVTGFTRGYAEMIADALKAENDCTLVEQ